jgi:hypothetical protein
MDVFLSDSSEIPLPRNEVRIKDLKANPYPDGRRVRIAIELTPFLEKPNGDIVVMDKDGNRIAASSFIETIIPKLEMTLHLRHDIRGAGECTVFATIFYTEEITDDRQDNQILEMPEKLIVDEETTRFRLDDTGA